MRELLQQHGDFKQIELAISRWRQVTNSEGQQGRWVTKSYLADTEKYTKKLCWQLDCYGLFHVHMVQGVMKAHSNLGQ